MHQQESLPPSSLLPLQPTPPTPSSSSTASPSASSPQPSISQSLSANIHKHGIAPCLLSMEILHLCATSKHLRACYCLNTLTQLSISCYFKDHLHRVKALASVLHRHNNSLEEVVIWKGKTLAAFGCCLLRSSSTSPSSSLDHPSLCCQQVKYLILHVMDADEHEMKVFATALMYQQQQQGQQDPPSILALPCLESLSITLAPLDLGVDTNDKMHCLLPLLFQGLASGCCRRLTQLSLPSRGMIPELAAEALIACLDARRKNKCPRLTKVTGYWWTAKDSLAATLFRILLPSLHELGEETIGCGLVGNYLRLAGSLLRSIPTPLQAIHVDSSSNPNDLLPLLQALTYGVARHLRLIRFHEVNLHGQPIQLMCKTAQNGFFAHLQQLTFYTCALEDEDIVSLAAALREAHVSLERLCLRTNRNLSDAGFKALFDRSIVAKLRELAIWECPLGDGGLEHFVDAFLSSFPSAACPPATSSSASSSSSPTTPADHPPLQVLSLCRCKLTPRSMQALARLLPSALHLTTLRLDHNESIGNEGIGYLAEGLSDARNCDSRLQELALHMTRMVGGGTKEVDGVSALVEAFHSNNYIYPHLKVVTIDAKLGEETRMKLIEALEGNRGEGGGRKRRAKVVAIGLSPVG